ncbi:uncharacterized protein LOC133814687 [Humulus lupulus]|uniref:uncharacterized protein LOC133814687 n=1 Tax=Humulus lupulus TaxID=3486 RepID=UPI002B40A7DD|nr:uncharacterized protein LOC133814687 [Humulus lupulus]
MKNLYKKGKIHSSLSTIDDHLSLVLPSETLIPIEALSLEDKVLAYLISSSNNSNDCSMHNKKSNAKKGLTLGDAANNGKDHSLAFNCSCFRCYKTFWARWDASPNRKFIDEIIEAYEEDLLMKNKNFVSKNNILKVVKKDHQKNITLVCNDPRVDHVELVKEEEEEENKVEESSASSKVSENIYVVGDEAEEEGKEDGEFGSEKGSTVSRLVGFIGEKVSALLSMS